VAGVWWSVEDHLHLQAWARSRASTAAMPLSTVDHRAMPSSAQRFDHGGIEAVAIVRGRLGIAATAWPQSPLQHSTSRWRCWFMPSAVS